MKRNYIQPSMKVVEVAARNTLLTGSLWEEGYTSGIDGSEGDNGAFY